MPPRSSPGLTSPASSPTHQVHSNQRSRRDLITPTPSRSLATATTNKNPWPVLRRRLDRHRLARHHGRRHPQRLSSRRSRPPGLRHPATIPSTRSTPHRPNLLPSKITRKVPHPQPFGGWVL